jgi:hypothetical protein
MNGNVASAALQTRNEGDGRAIHQALLPAGVDDRLTAQPCRSLAFRRRSPHHPDCRPSPSCCGNRWFAEFTTYALVRQFDGELDGGIGIGRMRLLRRTA